MARPSAGFAPAGMLRARTRPPSISSASGGSRRRRPGMGRTACGVVLVRRRTIHMYGFVRVRRRRTEHARDLRLIEEREEDRDALDDGGAELGIERHPVVQVPALDRLHLLPELAACACPRLPRSRTGRFELREPIPQPGIEPAGGLLGAGHRLPGPFREGFLVSGEILGRDDGPHRAEPVGQLAGLADLPAEQLRVDRAAVDVLQRDPAPGQEPVQFDDPAHEVRVGLLPERFSALAEELVDQGGDAVGERIGVEQRIVDRVPLPGAVEADLQVVAPAPGAFEDPAHVVAEARLSLRKSLWDKDLETPYGDVYHMVCPKAVNRVTRSV